MRLLVTCTITILLPIYIFAQTVVDDVSLEIKHGSRNNSDSIIYEILNKGKGIALVRDYFLIGYKDDAGIDGYFTVEEESNNQLREYVAERKSYIYRIRSFVMPLSPDSTKSGQFNLQRLYSFGKGSYRVMLHLNIGKRDSKFFIHSNWLYFKNQ